MNKNIENKVAIVTGGATGIGINIVHNFLCHGAKFVIIVDINEELANKALHDINERYGNNRAVFIKCDVSTDLEKFFDHFTAKYKNIDLLVNNAGIADETFIRKTITVNVSSLMEWSVKFYDYMRTDRNGNGGTIINIASIYGLRIGHFLPTYCGSKFAVVGFSKSLGHEYNFRRSGVRVIAVCPGFTYTPLTGCLRTRNDDTMEDFNKEAKSNEWQEVDSVGKGVKEIFDKADSGTVWLIEGSRAPVMVYE